MKSKGTGLRRPEIETGDRRAGNDPRYRMHDPGYKMRKAGDGRQNTGCTMQDS